MRHSPSPPRLDQLDRVGIVSAIGNRRERNILTAARISLPIDSMSLGDLPLASVEAPRTLRIAFERRELDLILRLYGRMVAAGEWRDYAIDMRRDFAAFSAFRRASEAPLYRIEKRPALARAQGAFSVIAAGGVILKRGHELDQVLRVFDRKWIRVYPES